MLVAVLKIWRLENWKEFYEKNFSIFLYFFFFSRYMKTFHMKILGIVYFHSELIANEIIYSYVISFMQYEVHDVIEYHVKINLYILYAILTAIKRKKIINEKKIHSYEQFSLFTIILLIINCQTFIFSSIKRKSSE